MMHLPFLRSAPFRRRPRLVGLLAGASVLASSLAHSGQLEESLEVLRTSGCGAYQQHLQKQAKAGDAWSLAQLPFEDASNGPCGEQDKAKAGIARLQELASTGNARARFGLAWLALYGIGVPRNASKAMDTLREMSEQGDESAMATLGVAYFNGASGARDEAAARALFSKLAARGNRQGEAGMGFLDLFGSTPDKAAGIEWLKKAARKGDPYALRLLASAYEHGYGVDQNPAQAAHHYLESALYGDWRSKLALGRLVLRGEGVKAKNAQGAARLFTEAERQGGVEAASEVGRIYFEGASNTPPDYAAALPWLSRAAQQGDVRSTRLLGWMYEQGEGVGQAQDTALRLYRQASDAGDAWAAFRLYQLLWAEAERTGAREPAMLQLERAAALAHPKAMLILAQAYDQGVLRPKDDAKSAKWWRLSADAGEAVGMFNLAVSYLRGDGVPQSDSSAMEWFGKASVAGHTEGLDAYKMAYRKVYPQHGSVNVAPLAEAGSPDAQYELAQRSRGDESDRWMRRAAEGGHVMAQWSVGHAYLVGSERIRPNPEEARRWLIRSAEGGNWRAFDDLAEMTAKAYAGHPPDPEGAKRWYLAGIEKARVIPGGDDDRWLRQAGLEAPKRKIGSSDEEGKRFLRDSLDKFSREEWQARFNAELEQARRDRQTRNLPPKDSDIQPLLLSAWARYLKPGQLQSDGRFSKPSGPLGIALSRTDMSVEDVSCVKVGDRARPGYRCSFKAREEIEGLFGLQTKSRSTPYTLNFNWTADGLESPDMVKVVQEQAAAVQARAKAAAALTPSVTKGYDAQEETRKWVADQHRIWCAGLLWSDSKMGQFWERVHCP